MIYTATKERLNIEKGKDLEITWHRFNALSTTSKIFSIGWTIQLNLVQIMRMCQISIAAMHSKKVSKIILFSN